VFLCWSFHCFFVYFAFFRTFFVALVASSRAISPMVGIGSLLAFARACAVASVALIILFSFTSLFRNCSDFPFCLISFILLMSWYVIQGRMVLMVFSICEMNSERCVLIVSMFLFVASVGVIVVGEFLGFWWGSKGLG